MKNCIVKIIDNAFEKNDEGGLFPLKALVSSRTAPLHMQARKWLDATFIGQTAICTMHPGHFSIFFPISSVVSGE